MTMYTFRAFLVLTIIISFFTTGVASAAISCPTITRTLSFGSRGADVTALQSYLATDKAIYPEGITSGYFGRATEKAVQRFQASRKIVSSGTPSSTGYGSVGVKTRAALAACNSGTVTTVLPSATSTPATATPATTPVAPAVVATTNPLITFNDGATTTITLGAGPAPSITTFSFSPRFVDLTNHPVTMSWISGSSVDCSVQKQTGASSYEDIHENVGVSGSVILTVDKSPVTYSLYCIGRGDNSTSSPSSIRRDIMVRINNPVPTCTVSTDKGSYKYITDSIKISWTSTDADAVSWEHGVVADQVSLPYGNQYPTGSIFVSSIAGTSQSVKLNVSGYGGRASCTASFSIISGS